MAYEIKILDLIDIELESSFLVLARNMGKLTRVKTWGLLLLGTDTEPILVETGARDPEIMQRLDMTGVQSEEQKLENQLARHDVKMDDVRWILHTHHHIDHGGQDERFPKATLVVSRLVGDSVPGTEQAVEHRTTSETREMGLGREQFWV